MKNLLIKSTQSSPEISFNFEQNILEFKGVSYPENTAEFYEPVFLWLEEFFQTIQNQVVTINIDLIYFNTSSSKVLMDFFDLLEEESEKGKTITINWYYDEDNSSSLEAGEEFQEDVHSLTFHLIEKKVQ